jgi:4-hydroxyphenylpyruvate dioxygenase
VAADFDIRLALEFVGWAEVIKDIRTARTIVEAAGRPNGGVLYDTFHHFFGGSTMDDLRALPTEQIFAVHLVDATRMDLSTLEISRKHRLFPGHGSVPFAEILSILHDKHYDGFMSLEMFNEQYWQRPPLEVAREGYAAMTRLIGAAGFALR